jgi:hypothetical protein
MDNMWNNLPTFAYIGPETILPATSALAAAGGVLMIFGRHIVRMFKWCMRFVTRQPGNS